MEDKSKNHQSETSGEQQVDVFFPDEVKKGVYANNVFINHTPEEIVLDFFECHSPSRFRRFESSSQPFSCKEAG